jgi:hypothetical protein
MLMASLAFIVAILFLGIILCGPTLLLLNKVVKPPKVITDFLSSLCILYGIWWIFVVVTPIRWIGLIPIYCGYLTIKTKRQSG